MRSTCENSSEPCAIPNRHRFFGIVYLQRGERDRAARRQIINQKKGRRLKHAALGSAVIRDSLWDRSSARSLTYSATTVHPIIRRNIQKRVAGEASFPTFGR